MKLYANTKGQDLIQHLKAIGIVCKELSKQLGMDEDFCKVAEIAGKTHDIGKGADIFKNYLNHIMGIDIDDEKFQKEEEFFSGPYHNEISWYVLSGDIIFSILEKEFPNAKANQTRIYADLILDAVFWHHPKSINDSYNLIVPTDNDDKTISYMLNKLFGLDYSNIFQLDHTTRFPEFYNKNPKFLILRAVLIAGDRFVSSLTKEQCKDIAFGKDITDIIKDILPGLNLLGYAPELKSQRDIDQFDCARNPGHIVKVKAPTGFGKTRIAVLKTFIRNKRTIWVCPRNAVAETVYSNILDEKKKLNLECSVELFLTGKRKEISGDENTKEFGSDIIVTNIDSLLMPMISSKVADKLYKILISDLVLDEYHEFVNDSPMFACFIQLMKARAWCKNSNTMLLSATPINIDKFWRIDDDTGVTISLPAGPNHYNPIHDKPIHLYHDDSPMPVGVPGSMVMLNSIQNTQEHYRKDKKSKIIHSKYISNDRNKSMQEILFSFGPGGKGIANGEFVTTAPILQAAMNISFSRVDISNGGAEMNLQAMRANRFGELDSCEIHIHDLSKNVGERATVKKRWNSSLAKAFYNFMLKRFEKYCITNFSEIYKAYNDFNLEYAEQINKIITNWWAEGSRQINEFAPTRKKFRTKKQGKTKKSGGKSLRSIDGNYFYIMRDISGKWIKTENSFSCDKLEFYNNIKDPETTLSKWEKIFIEHDYEELYEMSINGNKKDNNFILSCEWARNPETPYPSFSLEYDIVEGVIKNRQPIAPPKPPGD